MAHRAQNDESYHIPLFQPHVHSDVPKRSSVAAGISRLRRDAVEETLHTRPRCYPRSVFPGTLSRS